MNPCRSNGVGGRLAPLLMVGAIAFAGAALARSVAAQENDARFARESATAPEAVDTSRVAGELLRRTNILRKREGREALSWNSELAAAAEAFVQFMARTDRYGHEVDGRQPGERAKQQGYDYCIVAENLAYQHRSSGFATEQLAEALVEVWQKSPPHRRNMLEAVAVDSGAAVAQSRQTGRWYAVQLFGVPKSAQFPFSISNRADAVVRYRLGEHVFELAPRVTRTHKLCLATELALAQVEEDAASRVTPNGGEHYRIVSDGSGRWRLERE
jgi:uncharacterized protein YkwD